MTISPKTGDAKTQYHAAHTTHYTAKDLRGAFNLYLAVMREHPESAEAAYARTQIGNIVRSVVSASDLLDTHIDLVSARLAEPPAQAPEPTD